MSDEKANKNDPHTPKSATNAITTSTLGVWKYLTLKESFILDAPLSITGWINWKKYIDATPYAYRLLHDVYTLNPPLVILYLVGRAWKGIEPGILVYMSSQLFVTLEAYLRDGQGSARGVIQAIVIHLLCVIVSTLLSSYQNYFVPQLTSQTHMFFEEHLLRENLRYDVHTLQQLKKNRPSSYMGWYSFAEVCEAFSGVLGLFTIVTSILYQHHGGRLFTSLCIIYPLVATMARSQLSMAMVIVAENRDYIRLLSLASLISDEYREDIVNNNLSEYIMNQYKTSRERIGTLFTGNPIGEIRIETRTLFQVFRAFCGEIPVMYFACCAILNPTAYTMSTLAILRQQSIALTGSVQSTFQMLKHIMYTLDTVKGLYEVEELRLVDGTTEYCPPHPAKGMHFQLRNVSFAYPGAKTKDGALKDISVDIKPGQLVVIVGENGSGKSTLIKLLTRTYDVSDGEILLDDQPIQSYKLSDLRNATAVLNQDHKIYPMTLAENIGIGYSSRATESEDIKEAATKGGANDVIAGMRDGLDTVLEPIRTAMGYGLEVPKHQALQDVLDELEVTSKVSGGEKQRLVASRTFMRLRNPKIKFVAVDEPSSALDPRGELELFNGLRSERTGKTMIFVTHRFGHLTKYADLIICMKGGEIIETGVHRDLLVLNGEYAMLYNIQAQAFTSDRATVVESVTPPNIDCEKDTLR